MLGNVLRDAELLPVLDKQLADYRQFVAAAQALLADCWPVSEQQRVIVLAAIGHALSFDTWRSLVETEHLSPAQARDLMVRFLGNSADEPSLVDTTIEQFTRVPLKCLST